MKSPIFGKEKLLYFPQKSGIVPIFKKSPSSYISYFCHHAPCPRYFVPLLRFTSRVRENRENFGKAHQKIKGTLNFARWQSFRVTDHSFGPRPTKLGM